MTEVQQLHDLARKLRQLRLDHEAFAAECIAVRVARMESRLDEQVREAFAASRAGGGNVVRLFGRGAPC